MLDYSGLSKNDGFSFNNNILPNFNPSNLPSGTAYGLGDLPQQTTNAASSFNLPSIEALDAGVFTVGETGEVSFDYLFDGGAYEGELAIFNLKGMEQYGVGSKIFIQEAALRASQNDPNWGYVVIEDRTEGAKFFGNVGYEPDLNAGNYLDIKTFSLRPGTQFGILLVPNGTVKDALCNPDLIGENRPLFSISSANPDEAIQFAQLLKPGADSKRQINGTPFSFEDLQLNKSSDRDYNDLVLRISGATGGATLLDEIINLDKDWRNSEPGQKIVQAAVDPEDLAGNTIDKARIVGVASAGKSYQGWVGGTDTDDYYTFALGATNDFRLSLDGLRGDANVELLDTNGNIIQNSANSGTAAESINTTLSPGAYSVRVRPFGNISTPYNLELSATPRLEGVTTTGSEELQDLHTLQSLPLIRVRDTNTPANPTFNNDPRFAGINGAGFSTVIIDTGINLNHPFFGADANSDGVADRIVANVDFANPGTDASDTNGNGHGTNVSSIVASQDVTFRGVAPGANIISLKVFPDGASTKAKVGDEEQALQWVIENAARFNIASVNMSLGSGNFNASQTDSISDELQALANLGVIVVSSSGNNFFELGSAQGVASPSADPNSLSIGAVYDSNVGFQLYPTVDPTDPPNNGATANATGADRITPFSQRSQTLTTVFAPGDPITGAGLNNTPGNANYTSTLSGTSQAAPHVTGMAVLAQQLAVRDLGRRLTPGEFRELVRSTGVTINDGDDENDNVTNTGLNFQRVDMLRLGQAIPNLQTVTVTVNHVSGDLDPAFNDSDFYSLLSIDGGGETRSNTIEGKNDISPNWQLSKRNITTQTVPITIKIYDSDGGLTFNDDHADINPNSGSKDLNLIYNLVTGSVTDSKTGQEYGRRGQQINLSGSGDGDEVDIGFTIDGFGVTNPSPPPVTVNVHRVKGDFDGIFNDSDFYAQLSVAGKELRTPTVDGNSDLTVSDWNLSNFIKDRFVPVGIKIFDEDGGLNFGDDHIDINPNSGNKDLNLIYDQVTGSVTDTVTKQVYGSRGNLINLTGSGDGDEGEIWFSVEGPPQSA